MTPGPYSDKMGCMPRFVLLYHECPPDYVRASHWDLMFERGDCLWTWALGQLPREWGVLRARTVEAHPSCAAVAGENGVVAEQLGDHRLDYLELEGRLSGNRGSVTRIETGEYASESETPERWQIALNGSAWCGRILLERRGPDAAQWTLKIAQPEG
jgi:hypothetical protein